MFKLLLITTFTLTQAIGLTPALAKYGVGTSTMELVNPSQPQNPFHAGNERRRIMLSSFFPVGARHDCKEIDLPYMPSKIAQLYDKTYAPLGVPSGAFQSVGMQLCKATAHSSEGYPLVIFSPGMGDSRLVYSFIAASVASQGYVVVTMDHPYDAPIIEYPDGSTVLAFNITSKQQILTDLYARTNDTLFVIDQLQKQNIRQRLFHDTVALQYLSNIQMFGHSFGGATAAAAMLHTPNITTGINIDGTMFGDVLQQGLSCPFMLVSHEGKNLSTDNSWQQVWQGLMKTKVELTVEGSAHGTFTDFPFLAEAFGLKYNATSPLAAVLGTIPGRQVLEMLRDVVGDFFAYGLGHVSTPVKKATLETFPELEVIKMTKNGRC